MRCVLCEKEVMRMAKHYSESHSPELAAQRNRIVELYADGLSVRQISDLPEIVYSSKSSVSSVLREVLGKEAISRLKGEKISHTLKKRFSDGTLDWLKELNAERLRDKGVQESLLRGRRMNATKKMAEQFGMIYEAEHGLAVCDGISFAVIPLIEMGLQEKKVLRNMLTSPRCLFFRDEWEGKPEIVNSMIRYRLGKVTNKIPARKCKFVKLSGQEANRFFDHNHISGGVRSTLAFGLVVDSVLVSCISFRTPFHKKYAGEIEIARFASLVDHIVVGGFSKLFKGSKQHLNDRGYKTVITYADRRFGDGRAYFQYGFDLIGYTGQDYFYTDGKRRLNRFGFRAKNGKSEREIALEAGVCKVYGCGSNVFRINI